MSENNKRSFVMFLSAMIIYGTVGIVRRSIPFSSAFIAFFRGICGAAVLIVYAFIRRIRVFTRITKRNGFLLILSGAMMGLNWMMLFEAYNYTTVPVATLCYYMQPTFLIVLSPIFFKEKLTGRKLACTAVALAGMVLVSGVTNTLPSGKDLTGILYGIGAAVLYTFVVIVNKKNPGINVYLKTVIQLLSAAAALLPYVVRSSDLSELVDPGAKTVLFLAIIGVVHTGIAYALYFGSMDGLKSHTVALLGYVDPIAALIFSAVFFPEETLPLTGVLGAIMIIGAAVICETGSLRKQNTSNEFCSK